MQRGTHMSFFIITKVGLDPEKEGSGFQLMRGLRESARGANRRGGDGKLPLATSSTEMDDGKL